MNEADLRAYEEILNEHHLHLQNAAHLSAFLFQQCLDIHDLPEWHRAGCFMMMDQLVSLAEGLPFPSRKTKPDLLAIKE